MMLSLPLGWLKNTNRDQWMSQVLCWSDWRGELTDCEQRNHSGSATVQLIIMVKLSDSDEAGQERR